MEGYLIELYIFIRFIETPANFKFRASITTALNLVPNAVQPKFSSLLRRVSKVLKFALSYQVIVRQILKFHERVISALKFELSDKRSQILVVNS